MVDYSYRNELIKSLGYSSYSHYLREKLWGRIRKRVLDRDEHSCCVCGNLANQVHHRFYTENNLSGIDLNGMVSICAKCHKTAEFRGKRKVSLSKANNWIDGQKKRRNQPHGDTERPAIESSAFDSELEFLTGQSSPLRLSTGAEYLTDNEIRTWAFSWLKYVQKKARQKSR
jgi:hypothetical protein